MKYIRTASALLFLLTSPFIMSAQDNWDWSRQIECTSQAQFNNISYDYLNDRIAHVSEFQQDITFFKDYTSRGNKDFLLSILDENGDTVWIKHVGGSGLDLAKDVKFDNAGNVYVTGGFSGDVNFDGTLLSSANDEDVFMAKYSSGGNLIWAKNIGTGFNKNRSSDMAITSDGFIYMAGFFKDTLMFDDFNDTLATDVLGEVDLFLALFDTSGKYFASKHIEIDNNVSKIESVNIAHDGGLLLAGFVRGTMGTGAEMITSRGGDDAFVAKYNSALQHEWTRQIGGTGADRGYGAVSDVLGNIYTIGYISGTCGIDSTGFDLEDGKPLVSAGGYDMFIAKYNREGSLQWSGRNGDIGNDIAYGIDLSQNIINVGGYFSGTVIFGKDTIKSSGTTDNDFAFSVFNLDGNPIKARSIRGNGGEDRAIAMVYDGKGGQYLAGYFKADSVNIGTVARYNSAIGTKEGLVAKYNSEFTVIAATATDPLCYGVSSGIISIVSYFGKSPYTYDWSHDEGETSPLLTNLPAGTYKVVVTDNTSDKDSVTVTLTDPPAISIDKLITDVTCFGEYTGEIDITPSGGTPGYTYSWASATGIITGDEDQTGLAAGSYTVTVIDAIDCELDSTFTIMQPPVLVVDSFRLGAVTVPDAGDGWTRVFASGGTVPYTYDWNSGQTIDGQNTDSIYNLDGGDYIVDVTDAEGCINTDNVIISGDDTLLVDILSLQDIITCFGDADGSVTANVTGGERPFTWDFSRGIIVNDTITTQLGPGWVKVTVTDNTGMSSWDSVEIIEPAELQVTKNAVVDVTCFGWTDGSVDITITGGTPSYGYVWKDQADNTVSTDPNLVNVPEGFYTLTATDANGCTDGTTALIMEPDSIEITFAIDSALCFGESQGAIDMTVIGGTPYKGGNSPYTQFWSNTLTSEDIDFLFAGEYWVRVTDSLGCVNSDTANVGEPEELIAFASEYKPACAGRTDGQVIVDSISGGKGPYTFLWNDVSGQTTQLAIDLDPGRYYIATVSDVNGCLDTARTYLNEQGVITIATDSINHIYCEGDLGDIYVTVSGGEMPFVYDWSPSGQTAEDLITAGAGTHDLDLTDANGCSSLPYSETITDNSTPIIIRNSAEDVVCFGANDGRIILSSWDSGVPHKYSVDDGANWQTDTIFEGLVPGDYITVVTDTIYNCMKYGDILTISQPTKVVVDSVDITHISAVDSCDGELVAYVSGGTPSYQYRIIGSINQAESLFSDLCEGEDTLLVIDSRGCAADLYPFVIKSTPEFDSIVITNVACNGANTGMVHAYASGGVDSLSYQWTGGPATPDYVDLVAGDYTITVTDQDGVKIDSTITIAEPSAAITVDITNSGNNLCFGGELGFAKAVAAGGSGTIGYKWNSGEETDSIFGKAAGQYIVTAKDQAGCERMDTVDIGPTEALSIGIVSIDSATNKGTPDGIITIDNAAGGTATYMYRLDSGTEQAGNTFSDLAPGDYSVYVIDANSCSDSSDVVVGDKAVGILSHGILKVVSLYPNPSTGKFTIEMENRDSEDLMLEIVSITGQLVYKQLHKYDGQAMFIRTIDLGQRAKGTYFMRVNGLPVNAKLMIE